MSVRLQDYIKEHGYKKNEQGFKFIPPDEAKGKDVDIILTGRLIDNPYGYEVHHNQDPLEWDWQMQTGVYIEAWRISNELSR